MNGNHFHNLPYIILLKKRIGDTNIKCKAANVEWSCKLLSLIMKSKTNAQTEELSSCVLAKESGR